MRKNRRIARAVPWLILLLGWGLRLTCLGCQSLWYDEAFSLAVASADWHTFWQALLSDAVHPPAYYLLLKGNLLLFGDTEFGLRFASVVAGTLAIGLMWRLGSVLAGRRLALAASLLLALNPFAVWYAQEARMYSLVLCLAIAGGLSFWQLVQRPSWSRWLWFTLITAAGFLIHYFLFLLSLSQFLYLAFRLRRHYRAFRWWVLAQAVAAIPFLPWAWAVASREGRNFGIGWIRPPAVIDLPLTVTNLAWAVAQADQIWTWLGLALVLAAAAVGIRALAAQCRTAPIAGPSGTGQAGKPDCSLYLAIWLLCPLIFAWLLSLRLPVYVDRFFIVCLPSLLLLVSTVSLSPRRLARGIMIGVLLVSSVATLRLWVAPSLTKEDWRAAAGYIQARETSQDALVTRDFQVSIPLRYYYQGALELKAAQVNRVPTPLDELAAGRDRLWLVYRRPFAAVHNLAGSDSFTWLQEDDPALKEWLTSHQAELIAEKTFPGVYVLLYQLSPGRNP